LLARYELAEAQAALQTGINLLRGSIEQILLALAYGRLSQVQQALGEAAAADASLDEADAWLVQMRLHDLGFGHIIAAYRAWLALRQGKLPAAVHWADHSGLLTDIQLNSINELLYPILVRVLLGDGRFATAQAILNALREQITLRQWQGQMVEIHLLQALLHHAQNRRDEALAELHQALALGEAQGSLFHFIDEGQPVATLLDQIGEPLASTPFVARLRQLLADAVATYTAASILPEALSERELEVLRLAAAGATNREIAERLFIALPTVKKHMSNIFVKLDTTNRTQAIARAHELSLIA